ncbi:Crp/Fnr family transcriptional regulator [Acidimangrovimonas sediminis]|uniref:Crp/Fnr family transcriptional regulator n=1 Tax=Acidimangrovimonas sediminis TaxID=2056283 RepID=UPI001304D8E8|nr:Crp/Fnr family transcriptional regulator [Acidimangrovimonas sediminis]
MPAIQRPNHWFWEAGGDDRFVAVVRSGYLRLLQYSPEGRRMITGIAGPGAIVGEVMKGRGRYGLESSTEVSLCTFDRAEFDRIRREEPSFRRAVYAERSRALEALYLHIWARGLQKPEERLADFLLRAREILPYQPLPHGGGVLTLIVPRADIADLIGTSRETISRLTHLWQADGMIRMPDPQHLVIIDVKQLAQVAGLVAPPPVAAGGGGNALDAGTGVAGTGAIAKGAGTGAGAAAVRRMLNTGHRVYL